MKRLLDECSAAAEKLAAQALKELRKRSAEGKLGPRAEQKLKQYEARLSGSGKSH
jgi:hypothetical protein